VDISFGESRLVPRYRIATLNVLILSGRRGWPHKYVHFYRLWSRKRAGQTNLAVLENSSEQDPERSRLVGQTEFSGTVCILYHNPVALNGSNHDLI
jgi:hypothetical protein